MIEQAQNTKAPTRREFSIAALAAITALAAGTGSAAAAEPISAEEALKALDPWIEAVFTGDPAVVDKVLAPEFQILRADGSGYDRASYLANLPKFGGVPDITDMVFTSEGDLLVLRYKLRLEQKIADKPVQVLAPRLSVLRRVESVWLMVAHANFAQIG